MDTEASSIFLFDEKTEGALVPRIHQSQEKRDQDTRNSGHSGVGFSAHDAHRRERHLLRSPFQRSRRREDGLPHEEHPLRPPRHETEDMHRHPPGAQQTRGRLYRRRRRSRSPRFRTTSTVALENSRLYEDLKAMNKAKDRAISHLSHELKTPLALISAAITAASSKARGALSAGSNGTWLWRRGTSAAFFASRRRSTAS